jgi:uncharacterized membrane protein
MREQAIFLLGRVCVGTALRRWRDPGLRTPLGRAAGPILIAGCKGKLSASFSKNARRFGYSIWLIVACILVGISVFMMVCVNWSSFRSVSR